MRRQTRASCLTPEAALRGALRATPGEPYAVLGLGSLALILSTSSARRSRTDDRPSACSGLGSPVRRHRRRARRARAVRRGVRSVRENGVDQAESRVVRAHRVRTRADRRPYRRARGHAARARRCGRPAEPTAFAPRRAGQARARAVPGLGGQAARARCATSPSRLSERTTRARAIEAAGGRLDVAVALARRASEAIRHRRRSLVAEPGPHRTHGRSEASAVDRRGHRPSARGERRARRPRVGRLPRRQPHSTCGDGRSRASGTRGPTVDLRGRRACLGARRAGRCQEALPVARACAAARHPGRAPLLSPRLRGGCAGNRAEMVSAGARDQSRVFRSLGSVARAVLRDG